MSKDDPMTHRAAKNLRQKNVMKAAGLLTRLEKNAMGMLVNSETKELYEMTAGQIKSAEVFLRKTMPDLQSVDSTVTHIDERTGAEMKDEAISFLMKAGMSEEQANEALRKMAHDVTH